MILGHALWFRFVLANTGALPLTSDDAEVYGAFPPYFEAIQYWRDPHSGAWKEGRKVNNSSVGAVVAGLEELLRYLDCARAGTIGNLPSLGEVNTDQLRALIAKGRPRLEDTLPFESPPGFRFALFDSSTAGTSPASRARRGFESGTSSSQGRCGNQALCRRFVLLPGL